MSSTAAPAALEGKPPYPPFTAESAHKKVKAAQDVWNTRYVSPPPIAIDPVFRSPRHFIYEPDTDNRRNPSVVKNAYTPDSIWRNRDTFLQGRDEIVTFLTKKWEKEDGYRLRKELFAFTDNKVCDFSCLQYSMLLSECACRVSLFPGTEIITQGLMRSPQSSYHIVAIYLVLRYTPPCLRWRNGFGCNRAD